MNKVFHINLGGYPFTIDEDAYSRLTSYMATIEDHFRSSEGVEEIVQDIEIRMAELIKEKVGEKSIVTIKEVEHAIEIMGTPEDFAADTATHTFGEEEEAAKHEYKVGRRLFRNPGDKVIGGVCSGVSAYFGIEDPIWIRLLFVLISISGGAGIPLYIVLWIVMPEAKTAGDRLAMRGEPINVSNIARMVEEEVDHISGQIQDLTGEWGSKKKVRKERLLVEKPLPTGFLL